MTRESIVGLLLMMGLLRAGVLNAQTQRPDISTATPAFTVFGVRITAADIEQDTISLQLGPSRLTGTLTLRLVGAGGNDTILSAAPRGGGNLTESFDIPNRATGEYTQLEAVWTIGTSSASASLNYHIQVLGQYRHTQYNTPEEATCTGGPAPAYVTNAACGFSTTTFRSQFVSQTNLNGFGISINHGPVGREFFCVNPQNNPSAPADSPGRSFRVGATQNGSCSRNTGALNSSTVAVLPSHPHLGCGDRVYINTVGVKTITDTCPGCAQAQLDNFTTNGACSGITDLGTFMTIKLF